MMRWLIMYVITMCCVGGWIEPAAADSPPKGAAFALIIGSNRAGEGQEKLVYAWTDAERFKAVLSELGGHSPDRITTLWDPDPDAVRSSLQTLSERIGAHAAAGEPTSFVFYYSGHARASAVNLGKEEIPLTDLRRMIEAVPANFKLVVLDACQTGAISKVKGVTPASDFSYNSVAGLNKEGMAVIASSSGSELAQESSTLKGSFFTHHLVAALRGAADVNLDGKVTLEEAYQYTYDRTLVDTAKTAVGKQHVTLETELRGKGETVLSRTDISKSRLVLPEALRGEVLVFRTHDKHVVADIHKTGGNRLNLALPAAPYDVTVRRGSEGFECKADLSLDNAMKINLEKCRRIRLETPTTKGAHRRVEHLFFEVGLGAFFEQQDDFDKRLSVFGLSREDSDDRSLHFSAAAYYSILRYLKVGIEYSFLDDVTYDGASETFSWKAHRIGISVRGVLPVANDWLALYLQAGAGAAFGATQYERYDETISMADAAFNSVSDHQRFLGYSVSGSGGMQLLPWQYAGFFWQVAYVYAPVVDNLLGDTHNSGGVAVTTGFLGGF